MFHLSKICARYQGRIVMGLTHLLRGTHSLLPLLPLLPLERLPFGKKKKPANYFCIFLFISCMRVMKFIYGFLIFSVLYVCNMERSLFSISAHNSEKLNGQAHFSSSPELSFLVTLHFNNERGWYMDSKQILYH